MFAGEIPVVDVFYSLQGEGAHTGRAAVFIRLAGCDVGCGWCDSRGSWNAGGWPTFSAADIAGQAAEFGAKTAVVTGGEPLMHNLDELCERLHAKGMAVHLETSGTHPFSGNFDWVCLSPKRRRPPLDEVWHKADEIKVVIATAADFEWAGHCEEIAKKLLKTGRTRVLDRPMELFLQPEWGVSASMAQTVVEFVKANPEWRLSLQTHKYIAIP